MEVVAHRFDVYLVALAPTRGHENQKTRPCVIVSPDEMNEHISTVIIAPMTTQGKNYPSRIALEFNKKKGRVVLDQIRTVDKSRLIKRLGGVEKATQKRILAVLKEMFAP
ncbi:MAG: type II toxin-antitoxin system PemK/MazF family toxin [Gammaproteobacteria bacterium]